jgi:prepilin-type N-terminal cleavage/methylation domain-containing protein
MRNRTTLMASPSQPRDGFTLVEVLVVIGVIIVLAALLFPVMARVRQGGQRTVCLNNMKQLGLAFQQYTIDHDSRYPGAGQFQKWGNGGHWVKGTNTGTMFELANPENPTGTQADVQGGALYPYAKNPNGYIWPSTPYSARLTCWWMRVTPTTVFSTWQTARTPPIPWRSFT